MKISVTALRSFLSATVCLSLIGGIPGCEVRVEQTKQVSPPQAPSTTPPASPEPATPSPEKPAEASSTGAVDTKAANAISQVTPPVRAELLMTDLPEAGEAPAPKVLELPSEADQSAGQLALAGAETQNTEPTLAAKEPPIEEESVHFHLSDSGTVAPTQLASNVKELDTARGEVTQTNAAAQKTAPEKATTQKTNVPGGKVAAIANAGSDSALKAANDSVKSSDAVPPKRDSAIPIGVATEEEKNQKIAVDWPKPWAALFVTGQQHGYIEPCGCTGLENQKGGLNRRDTLLKQVRDRGWPVVPIDAGNQVRRFGRQAEMIFRTSVDAMSAMGYEAATFGNDDLLLRVEELIQLTSPEDEKTPSMFLTCNIELIEPSFTTTHKIIKVGNRKIGITGVLGDSFRGEFSNDAITIKPAAASLKIALEKIKKEKPDYTILLAHASLEESEELARQVPGFNLVVSAGGYGEPTYRPEPIKDSKSLMIQVGVKGMYVGLLGLYDDPNNPVRYQRIALSSQFEDSPRMMTMFKTYQEQLKREGFKGLELPNVTHPSGRQFVGTESCAECHQTAFDVWKDSDHAHATDSLVKPSSRTAIARHFDPECLSCHVTGWNPQKYYPYDSGYLSLEKTPKLVANGCENCHGPGSSHVAAENGDLSVSQEELLKLREEMRLPLAQAQEKCLDCHDLDNSPDFHKDGAFDEFWEQIKHYEKD